MANNIPTPHISAKEGEIAPSILLPGDPLRAKYIAENFLAGAKQFNSTRNMFGYTGFYPKSLYTNITPFFPTLQADPSDSANDTKTAIKRKPSMTRCPCSGSFAYTYAT